MLNMRQEQQGTTELRMLKILFFDLIIMQNATRNNIDDSPKNTVSAIVVRRNSGALYTWSITIIRREFSPARWATFIFSAGQFNAMPDNICPICRKPRIQWVVKPPKARTIPIVVGILAELVQLFLKPQIMPSPNNIIKHIAPNKKLSNKKEGMMDVLRK